jgi:mono/diheme cytochrome c family protein
VGDIPLSMRPYHSDEELETTGMERAMAWGVALATFAALFLPLYWLIEPDRINRAVEDQYQQDVNNGRGLFADACASCHGENLGGGSAPHPNQDIDAPWPAPALDNIVARYQDSEVVTDVREFIRITIERGRAGTPMPAFGVGEGGQYSDAQINAMVSYILSVQTGELPEAQAFEGQSGEDLFGTHCAPATARRQRVRRAAAAELLRPLRLDRRGRRLARAGPRGRRGHHPTDAGPRARRPMPPFAQVLDDDAIQALIDHLESFQVTEGPRFGQIGGEPQPASEDDDTEDEDQ